jgi:hypothetical protein
MTKVDAERMKRRMSHALRLHAKGTHKQFSDSVRAALERHFNNHAFCGDWCPGNKDATEEEVSSSGLKFCCKIRSKDMHLVMKKRHDEFMEEEKSQMSCHEHHTQRVEGLNELLTKFLPKDKTKQSQNALGCWAPVGWPPAVVRARVQNHRNAAGQRRRCRSLFWLGGL